ncbi:MAG: T9SS type A sorting domain-containing protein [Flavobacteriaceae bacterium]|nr:T9SS type A sorting domain-containing protein [Flavobacteriaceae bacterium]
MNLKITIPFIFGFIFLSQAQQIIPASGGNISSGEGSVSFTVAQLVYTTNSGDNYTVSQGVQQVYEISTLEVDQFAGINLEYSIYPNPMVDNLTLKIINYNQEDLSYQLYDMHGRMIKEGKLEDINTSISMQKLSSSIYFLRVNSGSKALKIFKIIKN